MKKFSIRAHDLDTHDLSTLITILESLDVHQIQLALSKSFPTDFAQQPIRQAKVKSIAAQLAQHQITVPILGCYTNIIDSNTNTRQNNLNLFADYLKISHLFPGSVVATETGSVSPQGYTTANYTNQAFQAVFQSVEQMVTSAQTYHATVAIEPGINHPLYKNSLVAEMIAAIRMPEQLKIIFDPVNLLTINNYTNQHAIIDEAFSLYGQAIVACHLKDFIIKNNRLEIVPFGKGLLDKTYLLHKSQQFNPNINYFLETAKLPEIKEILLNYHFSKCE